MHRILSILQHLPRKAALIWRVARECSPDWRGRLALLWTGLVLYVAQALPGRQVTLRHVSLRIAHRTYRITLTHFGDLSSIDFIIVKGSYASVLQASPHVRHIIDIGAHIGISTLYWHTHFPDALITAFEPDCAQFETLPENMSFTGAMAYEAAVAGERGQRWLYRMPGESQSNCLIDAGDVRRGDRQVYAIPLSDILTSNCLVAFNCEGSEYEIFPALGPEDWAKIAAAVGMVHRSMPQKEVALCNLFAAQAFHVTVHRAPEPCQQHILTAIRGD